MAPNPPDPHVRKRTPLLAALVAMGVILIGLTVVFHDKPGAGMRGSLSTGPEQSQR